MIRYVAVRLHSFYILRCSFQLQLMANYFEREVKRRAYVVHRWDFREQEKREIEAEIKRKAGVSGTSLVCFRRTPKYGDCRLIRIPLRCDLPSS